MGSPVDQAKIFIEASFRPGQQSTLAFIIKMGKLLEETIVKGTSLLVMFIGVWILKIKEKRKVRVKKT